MTLDETITMFESNAKHYRNIALNSTNSDDINLAIKNAEHFEQLSDWLNELKSYKGKYHKYYKSKYKKQENPT